MGQRRSRPQPSDDPFWDLVRTARRLQAPGGCSWDRAQTIHSLLPYLIEETWEVFEAGRSRRYAHLEEELGDVLYTVLFMTLVAERQGRGSLRRLLRATREKMVRRHPHVFEGQDAPTPEAAFRRWQASKRLEGKRGRSPTAAFRRRLVAQWERLRQAQSGGRRARLKGRTASEA
jgi:tetrapyrrole methylase family protein/MazG family protein